MGTTFSLPEEVLTINVAKYSFEYPRRAPVRSDPLSLRATCKLGADLVRRYLSGRQNHANVQHFPVPRGLSYEESFGAYPADMEASARHVMAVGTVFGAACKCLCTHGRSPE